MAYAILFNSLKKGKPVFFKLVLTYFFLFAVCFDDKQLYFFNFILNIEYNIIKMLNEL